MLHSLIDQTIRVMVVEDDPVTRRLLCAAIEREPSLSLNGAFASVAESIEWLKTEEVDVLLTDLGLPDGSGLKIIQACRRFVPNADIMVITISSDEDQVLACIEAGASGYVLKEMNHIDIVRALLELRAGGSPISPMIARKILSRMHAHHLSDEADQDVAALLTPRESSILQLIARGSSYAKVASILGLSVGTVQTHAKNIYAKLSVHSRGEAVYEAQRRGLLHIAPTQSA